MKRLKKVLCGLLAVLMICCLCACGSDSTSDKGESPKGDNNVTGAPQGDTSEATKEINVNGVTQIGDTSEISIVNVFATKDVMPPKASSVYSHYEAASGEVYLVVVMDVKNLGTDSVSADDILDVSINAGGTEYNAKTVVETEEGASLDSGYSTHVGALDTERLYQMFGIPEATDTENIKLIVKDNDTSYEGKLTLSSFESKIKNVTIGDTITDDETISLTIDNIGFTDTLYPPRPDTYYHYFEAPGSKTYLMVKMTVTNLKGSDMGYDTIAGVSCVYNDKYNYSFFTVFEEDGGADLNSFPGQYAIAPLDKGVVYYLAEVPTEVKNGPVDITFYIAGEYYNYSF